MLNFGCIQYSHQEDGNNFQENIADQNNFQTQSLVVDAVQESILMNSTSVSPNSTVSPTQAHQIQQYNFLPEVTDQNNFRTPSPVVKAAQVSPLANSTLVSPSSSTSLASISPTQLRQYHQQKYNFHPDLKDLNVNFQTTNPVVESAGSSTTVSPSVSSTSTTQTTSPTLNTPPTLEPKLASKKRSRTSFCNDQLIGLETEFLKASYLQRTRRILLSQRLNLSEKQIKVWFQNRRMKMKKMRKTDMPNVAPATRTMHSEVQSVGEPNISYNQFQTVNNTYMGNSQNYSTYDKNLLEHMHNVLNAPFGELYQWLNNL